MKKWKVRGSSAAFLLLLMAAAGCVAAPVYYLNDDVTMRGIVSGACTGTPDGHAVYMRYPLTWLLAGLYRLSGGLGVFVPWFDLFLAGCILLAGTGILSGCRELYRGKPFPARMAAALTGILIFVCLLLPQYLYMHYTVVAAILAGGALFLWKAGNGRKLPIFLLGLCYLVRSQVFFLALPFLLVAVLNELMQAGALQSAEEREEKHPTGEAGRQRPAEEREEKHPTEGTARQRSWGGREEQHLTEEKRQAKGRRCGRLYVLLRKQGRSLLALAVLTAVFWGIDSVGYGSGEWQNYRQYNDSRTDLYDYTDFLSTDRYQQCYELLGLSWEQFQVLVHYDTVLDRSIDAQVLDRTVKGIRDLKENVSAAEYLGQCLKAYCQHIRYDGRPYSLIWAGCYGILLVLLALGRRWDRLLLLAALAMGRSLIWIYLIAQGRFPERIWISLYLIEICLLLRMVLETCFEGTKTSAFPKDGRKTWQSVAVAALGLTLLGGMSLGQMLHTAERVYAQQEKQNQWSRLTENLQEQEDCLYLTDVFSAVAYAGRLYEADPGQIMLLGGWLTASPLVQQRLAPYGAADGAQALGHPQVRLVAAEDRDMAWLESYLEKRLGERELEIQKSIACGDDVAFAVYRLVSSEAAGAYTD